MINVDNYFEQPSGDDGKNNEFNIYGDVDANGTVVDAQQVQYGLLTGYRSEVIVKTAMQLSGAIDSDTLYIIDGNVDMGVISAKIPNTGIAIYAKNPNINSLYSSADNYTMFVAADDQSGAGGVQIEGIQISVTGSNSRVFNVDNTNDGGADEFNLDRVNLIDCTSLGYIAGYRQGQINNFAVINCGGGFEIDKTWSGFRVTRSIILGGSFPITFMSAGDDFEIGNIITDINAISVHPDFVLFDFDESNITIKGGFFLNGVRTTAINAVPNLSGSSEYARFRNCLGIRNTYVGSKWYLDTEAETVLTGVPINTAIKISGTTSASFNEWFSQPSSNQVLYNGNQEISVKVECRFSFSGTNLDQVKISVWKHDAELDSFSIVERKSQPFTLNASGRYEDASHDVVSTMKNGDYLEVRVENASGQRNVTLSQDSSVYVFERSS